MNEEVKITCDNDVMKYSPDQIYDYIYKLQNNWNELKQWLEEESKLKGSETAYLYYGNVLEKMQEMEGK